MKKVLSCLLSATLLCMMLVNSIVPAFADGEDGGIVYTTVAEVTADKSIIQPGNVDNKVGMTTVNGLVQTGSKYAADWVRVNAMIVGEGDWLWPAEGGFDLNMRDATNNSWPRGLVYGGSAYSAKVYVKPFATIAELNSDAGFNNGGTMTRAFGHIMGIVNQERFAASRTVTGASLVYKVKPGSYMATAVVGSVDDENQFNALFKGYDSAATGTYAHGTFKPITFAVSKDGETWTELTTGTSRADGVDVVIPADLNQREIGWNAEYGSFYSSYKVTAKIPAIEGADDYVYYRITLPGMNTSTVESESVYKGSDVSIVAYDDLYFDWSPHRFCGLGASLCSAYDLADYTSYTEVPDLKDYDPEKEAREEMEKATAALTDAIKRAKAYDLKFVKEESAAAKETFITKLAEAEAMLTSTSAVAGEKQLKAKELLNALYDLQWDLTDQVEILDERQGGAAKILKPGVFDNLTTSIFRDYNGTINAEGGYRTEYARTGVYTSADGLDANPQKVVNVQSYGDGINYSALSFFGQPITKNYYSNRSWAGGYLQYRVYGGSYVATAIIIDDWRYDIPVTGEWQEHYDDMKDAPNKVRYQVSKDNITWEEINAVSVSLVEKDTAVITSSKEERAVSLYKTVVHIPEGYSYYRIVYPGVQKLSWDTEYYKNAPDWLVHFGYSVASQYDLTDIDTLEDIPDYTAYYDDPTVEVVDHDTISGITEKYFKVVKAGTTIAQAKAAVHVTNGTLAFYDANGKLITDDSTKIAYGMNVDVLDLNNFPIYSSMGSDRLQIAVGNDIVAIEPIDDVIVDSGVEKSIMGLGLLTTTYVVTGNASVEAEIIWDIDGCSYDPADAKEQKVVVTGKVVLPEGVTNSGNLPLTITANVTVTETNDPSVRVKDGVDKVKLDTSEGVIYYTSGMTAAELLNALRPYGNVYYYLSKDPNGTGDVVKVADSEKVNSYMTLEVYSVKGDVYRCSLQLENMDPNAAPDAPDSSELPNTGMSTVSIVLAICLLCGAMAVTVITRKKNTKA